MPGTHYDHTTTTTTTKVTPIAQHWDRSFLVYPVMATSVVTAHVAHAVLKLRSGDFMSVFIFSSVYCHCDDCNCDDFGSESAGALPVLPGPGQLLSRCWRHINKLEGPIDMYFRHLTIKPQDDGLVKMSTVLAEDRVLSFGMVLRTEGLKTVWVRGATFYYEPM